MPEIILYLLSLIALDPGRPETNETTYRFSCEGSQVTFRFTEQYRSSEVLPLADRRRIRLLELSVSGRRIVPPQIEATALALYRYAWLTGVQGRCGYDGVVYLQIYGMPAQAWVDHIESGARRAGEPRPFSSSEFTIDARGELTVR